ncbi:MAG TPA: hypothetical protein VK054_11745, partial [Beutenbergiaceae bacterium]|nr:hypothetical protein [Beutenbergiaceae bacterium]
MGFDIQPLRYSGDVAAMVSFLEELGLGVVENRDGCAYLRAARGTIAVHPARSPFTPGDTFLTLTNSSPQLAADIAAEQGWDRASEDGRAWTRGPHGEWLCTVTTPQPTAQSADVRVGLGVSAIRSASDFAVDREFFAHFGFSPGAVANEWFEGLVGEGATGMLGLHHASPDTPTHRQTGMGKAEKQPYADIGFVSDEPLADLAKRMTEAGYAANV